METVIKRVGISELEELMKWREIVLREVFSISPSKKMDELLEANRNYYRRSLENSTHIACFAYNGKQIVGCGGVCLYQEMPSPDNPNGKCAYLMNIYTIPQMREHGIGKAVVEWLIKEAKCCGTNKIYLETSKKAYYLYKKIGFDDIKGYLKYIG